MISKKHPNFVFYVSYKFKRHPMVVNRLSYKILKKPISVLFWATGGSRKVEHLAPLPEYKGHPEKKIGFPLDVTASYV